MTKWQQSLLARLRKPDVFLVAKIMGGTACNFTPAERLFGIYSVGHLAMYAATEDYVPSESPVVKALVDAADALTFGTRGGGLEFDTFAILVSKLAAVDSQELFFDVKQLHASVVGAMESYGKRQEAAWDVLLMAEMRQRAAFRARSSIERGPLDVLLGKLTVIQEEHFDFARHSSLPVKSAAGPRGVNTVTQAAPPPAPPPQLPQGSPPAMAPREAAPPWLGRRGSGHPLVPGTSTIISATTRLLRTAWA
jgi:hypothetical protein